MTRHVVLLRGVNVGGNNRISMSALRQTLIDAGYRDVATYLQSGNVLLSSESSSAEVAAECCSLIATHFGMKIPAVARTREELANVVARDPFGELASLPKLYQVTFLAGDADASLADKLAAASAPGERFVVSGREVYAWHPDGIARSPLWSFLAGRGLGTLATARNWTTVNALLGMLSA